MRILCRVAATFRLPDHPELTYTITPRDVLIIRDAPEWITKTRLFDLLERDGSIEVIETRAQAKQAENAPSEGAGADGKKPTSRRRKKKEDEKGAEEAPPDNASGDSAGTQLDGDGENEPPVTPESGEDA